MNESPHRRLSFLVPACLSLAGLFCLSAWADGQIPNVDQEIEVRGLTSIVSPSPHASDVLATSLASIIHDPEVCCGRDSALEDSVAKADPKSLQDVAAKLNGRQLLGDGRPIMVSAEFFPTEKMSASYLLAAMTGQRAPLMEWDSHIYVVHGLVYFWAPSGTAEAPAPMAPVAHRFLLWDTRYSDSRRDVIFNRDTDDLGKVQGFLFIQVKPQ